MTFHLIFSDGGETGQEHFWKFYTVALTPFALKFPPAQVTLFLTASLVGLDPSLRPLVEKLPVSDSHQWIPTGYKEYFWAVYNNAVSIDQFLTEDEETGLPSLVLPNDLECDFRFVSGHGFNDFRVGGQLRFSHTPLFFENLGALPNVLTILDVSASPQAFSVLSGDYPRGDPKQFNWKKAFKDPSTLIPVVCDRVNSTWAFRVGYEDQPDDDSDEDPFARMTGPIGDSVACCLLLAIQSLVEDNFEGYSLDDRFKGAYKTLRTGFLPPGTN